MTIDKEGFTLWFTGLSGAGKTTLAHAVENELLRRGHRVEVLDGDSVRTSLSTDLGFSKKDRDMNVLRIGYVARLLSRNGVVAIAAAISPYREARDAVRRGHDAAFVEVYVDCSLRELVKRDPKGLYRRAIDGEIENVTGMSGPYEPPFSPEVHVHSDLETVEEASSKILSALEMRQLVAVPLGDIE